VGHYCVNFGHPSCIGFLDSIWINREKAVKVKNRTPANVVGVGDNMQEAKICYLSEKTDT